MASSSSSGRGVVGLFVPVWRLDCYCSSPTSRHAVSMRVCLFLHLQANEMRCSGPEHARKPAEMSSAGGRTLRLARHHPSVATILIYTSLRTRELRACP
jgi:hypothetical protein